MASITIRNLPDETKAILRVDAAKAGVSLEAYIRGILDEVSSYSAGKSLNIADAAQTYFGEQGADLHLPGRSSKRSIVEIDS